MQDHDGFSPINTLRGADWRGKDCDDGNGNFYPGRKPIDGDAVYDSNCNGIYGIDPKVTAACRAGPWWRLLCRAAP